MEHNKVASPVIVVHGGAGDIPNERVQGKISGVLEAARLGRQVLEAGGTALDACEAAVRYMEKDENFNAGRGSVLTSAGTLEMEAAVMEGRDLSAGGVTMLDCTPHPITAARLVMQHTPHVLLAGEGAKTFLREYGLPECAAEELITEHARRALLRPVSEARTEIGGGTVGAVALDGNGDLAAATSTGGMSGKLPGRIGDTPQLGSGTYADNTAAAVSATGNGDAILRYAVAARVCLAAQADEGLTKAAQRVLGEMRNRTGRTAGLIAVTPFGEITAVHTSPRMAWAVARPRQCKANYGIEIGQNDVHTYTD